MRNFLSLIMFLSLFAATNDVKAQEVMGSLCSIKEIESYNFALFPMKRIHSLDSPVCISDTNVYLLKINYDAPGNAPYGKNNVPRYVEICFNDDEDNPLWHPSNPQKFTNNTDLNGWVAEDITISFDSDDNMWIHILWDGEVVRFMTSKDELGMIYNFSKDDVLSLANLLDFSIFMYIWTGLN